jgi:hypothetical protein
MIGKKNLEIEHFPDGTSRVWGNCVFTGQSYECTVPTSGLQRWQAGARIQEAMPTVSAGDREFLISGISPAGWTATFGEE